LPNDSQVSASWLASKWRQSVLSPAHVTGGQAPSLGAAEQAPTLPGRLQAAHSSVHALSQQTPSTQKPGASQSAGELQGAPSAPGSVAGSLAPLLSTNGIAPGGPSPPVGLAPVNAGNAGLTLRSASPPAGPKFLCGSEQPSSNQTAVSSRPAHLPGLKLVMLFFCLPAFNSSACGHPLGRGGQAIPDWYWRRNAGSTSSAGADELPAKDARIQMSAGDLRFMRDATPRCGF